MLSHNESSTNDHHIVTFHEFSQLLESQPREKSGGSGTQIHRVPSQLRRRNEQVYNPMVVSLGPYHHGKPELRRAEKFKSRSLDWFTSGSDDKKSFLYNKVFEIIREVRCCYADVSTVDKYTDKALALMMLLDGCFVVNFMETRTRSENNFHEWQDSLGMVAAIPFTSRDIMVLENQIPFQVIWVLISLKYGKEEGKELFHAFMGWIIMGKSGRACTVPGEEEDPPLHILDACWRVAVGHNEPRKQPGVVLGSNWWWPEFMTRLMKKNRVHDQVEWTSEFGRSVMDLKAKGIKFMPSLTGSLRDTKFTSFAFHGQLEIPVGCLSESNWDILLNLIAYEVSPGSNKDLVVSSYVSFMKSLIQSPNDVKELQEKGIWINRFSNNKEAVKFIKNIDTFGLENCNVFDDMNERIRQHCNNKAKTWMADLIHTRFRSPWTVIALLAATLLLILTFMQTYFTIRRA